MLSTPAPSDDLTATLEQWSAIEQAATPGPWWSDESDECWRLHGVAFKVPPQTFADGEVMIPEQVMNKQILKAPKHGTPYAEYWPDEADAAFIVTARTAMPALLAAVGEVLKLTEPSAEPHVDLDGNEEQELIRVVRCDVLREAITRALTGGDGNAES